MVETIYHADYFSVACYGVPFMEVQSGQEDSGYIYYQRRLNLRSG